MGLSELKAMQEGLARTEAQSVPGALDRTPKEAMLDASDVEAKHPDSKIRWVNIKDPQKAASRQQEGYRRLTSEEGGKQIGDDLVLMGVPRERYNARVNAIQKLNDERMVAHNRTMQEAAEGVARALRDQHGISISANQLLTTE